MWLWYRKYLGYYDHGCLILFDFDDIMIVRAHNHLQLWIAGLLYAAKYDRRLLDEHFFISHQRAIHIALCRCTNGFNNIVKSHNLGGDSHFLVGLITNVWEVGSTSVKSSFWLVKWLYVWAVSILHPNFSCKNPPCFVGCIPTFLDSQDFPNFIW